jgi:CBS domain-containing protein
LSTATASGSAGIVTERDILHGLVEHGTTPLNKEGGDIMTRKGITATPTADVGTLMGLVTKRRCRYIPAKEG